MKKFLRSLLCTLIVVCSLAIGVFGFQGISLLAKAEEEPDPSTIKNIVLNYDDAVFYISSVEYVLNGENVIDNFEATEEAQKNFSADLDSEFRYLLKVKDELNYQKYYISDFNYQTASDASKHTIARSSVDKDGLVSYSATVNSGRYEATINTNYFFSFTFNNTDGTFDCSTIIYSDIIINMGSDRIYSLSVTDEDGNLTIEGCEIDVEDDKTKYLYGESLKLSVNPDDTRIIDRVTIKYGAEEILSIYGGMQTNENYWFKDEFIPKNGTPLNSCYLNRMAYGTRAMSFVSDSLFEMVQYGDDAFSNNAVTIAVSDPQKDSELFIVSLNEDGSLAISTSKVSEDISISISTQKYAQVDLQLASGDNLLELSSEPFKFVQLGSVKYGEGEEVTLNGLTKLFAVGYVESIRVEVALNDGYSFYEDDFIVGSNYVRESFGGGHLAIAAYKINSFLFTVSLYRDGQLFANADTKIYLAIGEDDFSTPVLTSTEGKAVLRNVDKDSLVKVKVEISPYYLMTVGGVEYAGVFEMEHIVSGHYNLSIDITYFSIERDIYFEDEVLGQLKISVDGFSSNYDPVNREWVYEPQYYVSFKSVDADDFTSVTKTNPYVYGYNLVNFKIKVSETEERDILKYSTSLKSFGVENNVEVHKFISNDVYNSTEKIVAYFESKLLNFTIDNDGDIYRGIVSFNDNAIYLDRKVENIQTGYYLAGIGFNYLSLVGYEFEVEIVEAEPEVVAEGVNAGKVKYLLTSNWNFDDNNVEFEPIFKPVSCSVEFVFYNDGSEQVLTSNLKYGDVFNIAELISVSAGGYSKPYKTGHNLIGWKSELSEEVKFIVADDADVGYSADITVNWIGSNRFVSVFTTNKFTVYFYDDNDNILAEHHLSYNEEVNLENLLKIDGEWIVLSQFGYTFDGFYFLDPDNDDQLVFEYVEEETPYIIHDSVVDFFEKDGEEILWKAELENISFKGMFKNIKYELELTVKNDQYKLSDEVGFYRYDSEGTELASGELEWVEASNYYLLRNFTLVDTISIIDIESNRLGYIAEIKIGYKDRDTGMFSSSTVYLAECAFDGEVLAVEDKNLGHFDTTNDILTIVVSEYITEENKTYETIVVEITYQPITYLYSFKAEFVNESGSDILSPADTIDNTEYYLVKKENCILTKDSVSTWTQVEVVDGQIVSKGSNGWITVDSLLDDVSFGVNSLFGISGIKFEADGEVYSFKKWMNQNNVLLKPSEVYDDQLDFVAMFTTKADVTINYYVYNDINTEYILHDVERYFWTYMGDDDYSIGQKIYTKNDYRLYSINDVKYYISAWNDGAPASGFINGDLGIQYIDLKSEIVINYTGETIEFNYYAVYKRFIVSLTFTDGSDYTADISLPNDAEGNSYTNDDIIWIKVKGSLNSDPNNNLKLSDVDVLHLIYNAGHSLDILAEGRVLSKEIISEEMESNAYLYAVVRRKIAGVSQNNFFYVAKLVKKWT